MVDQQALDELKDVRAWVRALGESEVPTEDEAEQLGEAFGRLTAVEASMRERDPKADRDEVDL